MGGLSRVCTEGRWVGLRELPTHMRKHVPECFAGNNRTVALDNQRHRRQARHLLTEELPQTGPPLKGVYVCLCAFWNFLRCLVERDVLCAPTICHM